MDRGYSVAEVSSRLGVSSHSLYQWVKAVKPDKTEKQASELSINGMFFGLMRRELWSTLVFPTMLGGDWLLMSQVAYFGKTRTLETVSINRSAMGESENLERLALRVGLTPRQAKNPHFVTAKYILAELGWKSPSYPIRCPDW